MTLVFQYGSNTSKVRINAADRLNGDAQVFGIGHTVEPYELEFTVWSKGNNCAAASISPGHGRAIWGVIYDISDQLIQRQIGSSRRSLDGIEGEGQNYRRMNIALDFISGNKTTIEVMTYVAIKPVYDIQTSLGYVSHIINGLREHNISEEYVDYVRSRAIANNSSLSDQLKNI